MLVGRTIPPRDDPETTGCSMFGSEEAIITDVQVPGLESTVMIDETNRTVDITVGPYNIVSLSPVVTDGQPVKIDVVAQNATVAERTITATASLGDSSSNEVTEPPRVSRKPFP